MAYLLTFVLLLFSSCASDDMMSASVGQFEPPKKIYDASFQETWAAILQIIRRYEIAELNQEAGIIKTEWINNTLERNFQESFSNHDAVKSSRYKLIITVVKGKHYGREVTKVRIYLRQFVEEDFLQGWREVATDGIKEKVILYRIGHLLKIDRGLKKMAEEKKRKQIESL